MTDQQVREFGQQVGRLMLFFNKDGSPCDGFMLREELLKTRQLAWELGFFTWLEADVEWEKFSANEWAGRIAGKDQFLITKGPNVFVLYLPNSIVTYKRLSTAKQAAARYYKRNGWQPPLMLALVLEGGPS